MKSEIHLFIIWSEGLYALDEINIDISLSFRVVKQVDITWSKDRFSENLSRFYGESLPKNSFKEKHCGSDTFRVIVVKDLNPKYQVRQTSKGNKLVNSNLFDAKQKYRLWTGGGHKIHATDSVQESLFQLPLLLGDDYNSLLSLKVTDDLIEHKHDLIGSSGWQSIEQIFTEVNKCCNYVVMRNYESLEDEIDALHPDIDILCDDRLLFVRMINGIPTTDKVYRAQYYVYVGAKKIFFDVRSVGDNYYDEKWSRDILRSRQLSKGLYIPSVDNYFFSLIYHALLHKTGITQEYTERLSIMFDNYDCNHNLPLVEDDWIDLLVSFMDKHGYIFVEPSDLTVFWNKKLIDKLSVQPISKARRRQEQLKKIKQIVKFNFKRVLKKIKQI